MTLAGSLSWLRDLAVHNQSPVQQDVVAMLVQAGYLTPAEGPVERVHHRGRQRILEVCYRRHQHPMRTPATAVARRRGWNHMDRARRRAQANGSAQPGRFACVSGSGSGSQGPVEQDVYTDPDTVKHYINAAAQNVLGRKLTDDEVAQFASAFHSTEASWNKQKFKSDTAQYNGQASTMTDRPNASAAAENYV
jgi:hypothetical protein